MLEADRLSFTRIIAVCRDLREHAIMPRQGRISEEEEFQAALAQVMKIGLFRLQDIMQ